MKKIKMEEIPKSNGRDEGVIKYSLRLFVWILIRHTWKFIALIITSLLIAGAFNINTKYFKYQKKDAGIKINKLLSK